MRRSRAAHPGQQTHHAQRLLLPSIGRHNA
jgi:hypothetical protein